jgi:hypothetical protein
VFSENMSHLRSSQIKRDHGTTYDTVKMKLFFVWQFDKMKVGHEATSGSSLDGREGRRNEQEKSIK